MSLLQVVSRIVLAAVLGGLVGIEREIQEHTAGFRTHILVSVGAAAFTVASAYQLEGTSFDPNRITAQIVSGIGFLGAGAIIRYGVSIRGLTTAASLWTVAAVGLAAGKGFYTLALVTTILVIISLYLLRLLEDRFLYRLAATPVSVRVRFLSSGLTPVTEVLAALEQAHVAVKEIAVEPGGEETNTLRLVLRLPRGMSQTSLTELLMRISNVEVVAWG